MSLLQQEYNAMQKSETKENANENISAEAMGEYFIKLNTVRPVEDKNIPEEKQEDEVQ